LLKIPKEVDYGILILLALMEEDQDELIPATEMARRTQLSHHQVAKLLKKLQKGGVVESIRGPKGGYRLCIKPDHLTLSEIYEYFFGALRLTDCTSRGHADTDCRVVSSCSLMPHMAMVNQAVEQAFSKITLARIRSEQERMNQKEQIMGV